MSALFVFLLMIFLHIVDDYYLQGWLASAKQKEWWQKNASQKLYENDYKCALLMHSLSWSFMTMLPIALAQSFNIGQLFYWCVIANAIIHGEVDNLKANEKKINLWTDQTIHITQITVTFLIFYDKLG